MKKSASSATLADVGKLAGVSKMTASMVLRSDPRISLSTREKVRKAARKLAYVPDPMLSALAARRQKSGTRRALANIAVLLDDRWVELRNPFWPSLLLKSMEQSSRQIGYHLEILHLKRDLGSVSDPNRLLKARGIRGLLLPSTPDGTFPLAIRWQDFALVTTGILDIEKPLHRVESNYFSAMSLACGKLHTHGYRRVLLANPLRMEERVYFEWLGSMAKESHLRPGFQMAPPYLPEVPDDKSLLTWIRRHQPDSVITNDARIRRWLMEGGYRIPEDIGMVFMSRDTLQIPDCSGVSQNIQAIGEAAVELLHSQLIRGQTGFPKTPRKILIPPKWKDGNTIKKRKT